MLSLRRDCARLHLVYRSMSQRILGGNSLAITSFRSWPCMPRSIVRRSRIKDISFVIIFGSRSSVMGGRNHFNFGQETCGSEERSWEILECLTDWFLWQHRNTFFLRFVDRPLLFAYSPPSFCIFACEGSVGKKRFSFKFLTLSYTIVSSPSNYLMFKNVTTLCHSKQCFGYPNLRYFLYDRAVHLTVALSGRRFNPYKVVPRSPSVRYDPYKYGCVSHLQVQRPGQWFLIVTMSPVEGASATASTSRVKYLLRVDQVLSFLQFWLRVLNLGWLNLRYNLMNTW